MSDIIEKYIDLNREDLDLEVPNPNIWDKVKDELHPEIKKKKVFGWYKVASVLLIAVTSVWYFFLGGGDEKHNLSEIVTIYDFHDSLVNPFLLNNDPHLNAELFFKVPYMEQETGPGFLGNATLSGIEFSHDLNPVYTYQWDFGDGTVDGQTVANFAQAGNYTVTVVDGNGCSGPKATGTSLSNITTAVPFLIIAPDSRNGSMGEVSNGAFDYGTTTNRIDVQDKNFQLNFSNSGLAISLADLETSLNSSKRSYAQSFQEPIAMQKVIRGGSWKDIAYYLETGDRAYEYSDRAKSYVGYRSVMTYLGRGWYFDQGGQQKAQPEELEIDVDRYYEEYEDFTENAFIATADEPISTFSIDVDGAGYSNVRRYITGGYIPPKNAVKLEEMINYFNYDLPEPEGEHPISLVTETGICPWDRDHMLLNVAMKGKTIDKSNLPPANLVFLIDVSGSMSDANKLPLLKSGFSLLIDELRPEDKVSIVVYAGAAGEVLPPTLGSNKPAIREALERLSSGGSTAGGEGIELAYKLAKESFLEDGNNRIILATDGDFNVGISNDDALVELIEEKRKTGVYLSVLGFGTGNLQSNKMEKLADNGNGNYSYIDNIMEAKKVFVNEFGGTLFTIAKDVKMQLVFNPEHVESYRLLGYENRMLATEDFDDDTKDAGELGSGHTIMALYEVVTKEEVELNKDPNYHVSRKDDGSYPNMELVNVKFRYKPPKEDESILLENGVTNQIPAWNSNNFKFSTAVAEYGLLLRESQYKGSASIDRVIRKAKVAKGKDDNGYRAQFIWMAESTKFLLQQLKRKQEVQKAIQEKQAVQDSINKANGDTIVPPYQYNWDPNPAGDI